MAELRLSWPCESGVGQETGQFGEWYHFPPRPPYQHRGWDIGASFGAKMYAMADGPLVSPVNDGSFGPYAICIYHEESGLYILQAHGSAQYMYPGQRVKRGDLVGAIGNLGTGDGGAHVHVQVCTNNRFPIDISYSRDPKLYYHPEDDMPDPRTDKLIAALGGEMTIDSWNANGNSLLLGYTNLYNEVVSIKEMMTQMQQTLDAVAQQTYGINDLLHAWRTVFAMQGINLP